MSHADSRCPRCAALVPPQAPWCTLCYADLRPPAEPAPTAVAAAAPVPEQPAEVTVAAARAGRHRSASAADAAAGDLLVRPRRAAAPTETDPETGAARWPCQACGEQVSFDLTACHACGAGFLDVGADPSALVLPFVGDLLAMSRGRRVALGVAAAAALGLLLLLLATVLGLVV